MAKLPRNNAFGAEAPSWNLSFPKGNLTACEIIAYTPHWLKSIDVIDRFVTNGAKSSSIASLVNEFRDLPTTYSANSAQIMMSYSMRRAGYDKWQLTKHHQWAREQDRAEDELSVADFRAPRVTHPKMMKGSVIMGIVPNLVAEAVQFSSLARHVRKHPSGLDALDMTRCVQYAIAHPEESWLFPDEFEALVEKLGGPVAVTHGHCDRQIFARRAAFTSERSASVTQKLQRKLIAIFHYRKDIASRESNALKTVSVTIGSYTSRKRKMDEVSESANVDSVRKSTRLATKAPINFRDGTGSDSSDFGVSRSSANRPTTVKKRKTSGYVSTHTFGDSNSDFVQDESDPDEEITITEEGSEDELVNQVRGCGRAAAHRARQNIKLLVNGTQYDNKIVERRSAAATTTIASALADEHSICPTSVLNIQPYAISETVSVSNDMMDLARIWQQKPGEYLPPPTLPNERLRVDELSVHLYAAEGCHTTQQLWNTALSSSRFGGPRHQPPWRELYRLTDPHIMDTSDWAENIRWAKEQFRLYGSTTWTEYETHLETINEHRFATFWVSEECIMAGMPPLM